MVEIEIIDLEEYSKSNRKPEKKKRYRIKVDHQKFVVDVECMIGAEILELAGKTPTSQYQLRQKIRGGKVIKIGLDDKVNFCKPGIEKFMTIPLDQTEG
ncbi:multiubiquitin domain-containing protein [Fulvivirgaceae bacterium BMA10]|uniref:Multiubiquitin domain-containing protein n=1 Tax=Splendidivirga corallicola TaxID=3051826 RepID=A0ABT8KT48_9BACT|nr:multiubiquitin domain-containing protein [Fulvivirgaceae bacterium BMA10]